MAASEAARLTRARRAALLHGIYVIVNEGSEKPLALARAALDAGVRVVQYRAKRGILEERLRDLRRLAHGRGALLLLDDDPHAAAHFDCDGVHLGPGDPGFDDVPAVRAALGERLIGLSCATADEARAAQAAGADYIGAGAVFATASKDDAGAPIGLAGLRRIVAATRLPVAAIGGISLGSVAGVARCGAAMAAVISAVSAAADPAAAAGALVEAWERATRR